ncbi:DNA polymerase III subunit gamma/tau [Candidatus Parcubacteria bacterium]|nr:DNA polymerase III subunit gamma/tau [Candidatus Parcubacteria bacterium]
MSEVLYRKYRPLNFDDVVGQQHVIKTIKNSIKNDKVAHAYLFSGSRGIGKTTIARILAKVINCQDPKDSNPCNQCEICQSINQNQFLDMVEIDAATHTQVDKMRDIIDRINFTPSLGKYKVYIIDEIHMLSKGAFNALLKTLEEPPSHVVFILATTEIHKIPATIISRCQRFDFRRLKVSEITNCLAEIAEKEKVKVSKEALDFIAINANGGMRDSESLFGQILSVGGDKITLEDVQEILSVADISISIQMVSLILEGKYSEAIKYIDETTENGYDIEQFTISIIEFARKLLLIKISPEMEKHFSSEMTEEQIEKIKTLSSGAKLSQVVKIIREFIKAKEGIRSAIIPQLPLELAIAQITIEDENERPLTSDNKNDYNRKIVKPIKKITEQVSKSVKQSGDFIKKSIEEGESIIRDAIVNKSEEAEEKNTESVKAEKIAESEGEKAEENTDTESSIGLELVKDEWCDILEDVKPHNHSLTAFLKTCLPVAVIGNEILISCEYSFHKDKLNKFENKTIVENVMKEIFETEVLVKFISHDEAKSMGYDIEDHMPLGSKKKKSSSSDDLMDSALEMFGGEVV